MLAQLRCMLPLSVQWLLQGKVGLWAGRDKNGDLIKLAQRAAAAPRSAVMTSSSGFTQCGSMAISSPMASRITSLPSQSRPGTSCISNMSV